MNVAEVSAEIESALSCRGGRREGSEIRFLCPEHDDHDPSASWNSQKGVWFCQVCQAGGGFIDLASRIGIDLTQFAPADGAPHRVVAHYDYTDEHGALLFQVERRDPKGFVQRRPDGDGGWIYNLRGTRRVLYRVPDLQVAIAAGRPVYIVEGEKDADALCWLGLAATTNAGGAGKWRPEYTETLRGAHVAILPDNDPAGREHAEKVARALHTIAASIRIVDLPSLPTKGDLSDWLATGGTREGLEALVAATPLWTPAQAIELAAAGCQSVWPARQPLRSELPDVPTLPAELIPEPLRDWIADAAERLQVPPEMIAAPALVTLGALIGRTVAIRPKRYDDWTEVPNLWGGIVGRPGIMKSPAVQEATRHIRRLAAAETRQHAAALAAAELAAERIQLAIEQTRRRGRKPGADLGAIGAELAKHREDEAALVIAERRYLTQDATPEKLGELLCANPRGLLVLRDELAGWLAGFNRAGREGEREFFLEAWRGVGSFTYDRIGRGTLHIPALTLSILGTIQPGKLKQHIAAAVSEGRGDDGLLQRMQMTVWPDVQAEWTNVDRWPNSDARQRAATIYDKLDTLKAEDVGAAAKDSEIPFLHFTSDAQELFDAWRGELERRLRGPELTPFPAYESHVCKHRSLMPSLALICHLIDVVDGRVPAGPIGLDAARRAAAWVEFLDAHARRIYAVELEPGRAAARALAERIEAGAICHGDALREIYRAQWSGLDDRSSVDCGLAELARLGWLRLSNEGTSGRPSRIVELHPELRGQDA